MTHDLTLALGVAAASGLLYMALGAWVLTLTPRRRQTVFLAAFTIGFGFYYASGNLAVAFDLAEAFSTPTLQWIQIPVNLFVMGSALGLAASVPEPLEDRGLILRSLAYAFVLLAPLIIVESAFFPEFSGRNKAEFVLARGAVVPAAVLLVLRSNPKRSPPPASIQQWGLLAVAFALLDSVRSGVGLTGVIPAALARGDLPLALFNGSIFSLWFALTLAWTWNMFRAEDDTVRIHRAVLIGLLACLTAGAWVGAIFPTVIPGDSLLSGIARTLGVGLLAYGILRHDIAGLDQKVEFGVSKTTVAGVFIAVFFIAGELAETFFGDVFGPYVGVIAAGLLVFALSPIQRMADRFAARTVPGGAEAGADAEARYRREVEMALADGEVSREEERKLGRRAAELGIDAERALELRDEVQDEGARENRDGGAGP